MSNTLAGFDAVIAQVRALIEAKDHDYGAAWRFMRQSSITDQILVKALRIRTLEQNGGNAKVSEGIESEFRDILSYAAFALIKLAEGCNQQ